MLDREKFPVGRTGIALTVLALGAMTAATVSGCGSSTPSGQSNLPGTTTDTASHRTTAPTGGGTTTAKAKGFGPASVPLPDGEVDQAPPKGANGLAWDGQKLWMADLNGGQILAVDPRSGKILGRFGESEGVTGGPDDLAVGPDGAIYWTGFNDGIVGRLGPDGRGKSIANVGPGANPIAFSPEGKLFVGRAVTAEGLYEVDPTGSTPPRQVSSTTGNVNGFAFGPDGAIYGPRYEDQKGSVVRIDPASGETTEVVGGLGFVSALKFGPEGKAYVLSSVPKQVLAVDLQTKQAVPYATPATQAVDNLAYDGDGSLVVSGFNEPALSVIPPTGGEVRLVRIGKA